MSTARTKKRQNNNFVKTLRTGLVLSSIDAMDANAPTNRVWYVLRPYEGE